MFSDSPAPPLPSVAEPSSSSPELVILQGVLERIVFANEQNHYCVGEVRDEASGKLVTILGTLPNVQCGETLELGGEWREHPTHGRQFAVSTFKATLPSSVHGIRKYLGSGLVPGIGAGLAQRIVDHFGAQTLQVIEEESKRLQEVDGIGAKRALEIKKAWDDQRALRQVLMFLQTYGVTVSQCLRLVKRYGNQAPRILREDPYVMANEIDGIGFRTADKLARNLGFANDAPARLAAGLIHTLQTLEEEGHTAVPAPHLREEAARLLECEPSELQLPLENLRQQGLLHSLGPDLLQTARLGRAEQSLADRLHTLRQAPSRLPPIKAPAAVTWAQERAGFAFAPEQQQALLMALQHPVSILTGGPGTGKTTILRALGQILRAKQVRVLFAAPTGRAAQRLAESTGSTAATIHRLLKYDAATGGFVFGRDRELPCDFLVVDESSMLDTQLAAALFKAVPPGAHLLLVGDTDQLPSVGPGQVLQDLIESQAFPVTRLQRIFRQGEDSGIVGLAHAILSGDAGLPPLHPQAHFDPERDLQFIPAAEPEACALRVREVWQALLRQGRKLDDLQVLVPMHRGPVGTAQLNANLQTVQGERPSLTLGTTTFALGDKVIFTRNNYDKGLFNGDLGRITAVNPTARTLSAVFDGERHDFDRGEMGDLSLAYAITVHKSQGSEFPVVLIPLVRQHFLLLQRNLLYTALTRGKQQVVLLGDPSAYRMAVRNQDSRRRVTGLGLRMR